MCVLCVWCGVMWCGVVCVCVCVCMCACAIVLMYLSVYSVFGLCLNVHKIHVNESSGHIGVPILSLEHISRL